MIIVATATRCAKGVGCVAPGGWQGGLWAIGPPHALSAPDTWRGRATGRDVTGTRGGGLGRGCATVQVGQVGPDHAAKLSCAAAEDLVRCVFGGGVRRKGLRYIYAMQAFCGRVS
jgi:hypothetical protein